MLGQPNRASVGTNVTIAGVVLAFAVIALIYGPFKTR
jgi:hypothetical protein